MFNIFPNSFHNWTNGKMFVSLVSAKDFFSLIIKKSIENYKVNNFDISLDPFDIKIWIWQEIAIKPKDVEFYYSYTSAAHYNGYRFFTVSNIATNLALIAWNQNRHIFYKSEYFSYINYILSVYLMCYIFGSGIKTFPKFEHKDQNDLQNQQYKRFLEVFFSFWDMIMSESKVKINTQRLIQIKKELTMNLQMFFGIFYSMRMLNEGLITWNHKDDVEYFERLLTQKSTANIDSVSDFIDNYKNNIYSDSFDTVEQKIAISIVCPYDIHIKYFYNQENAFQVNDLLVSKIFDNKKIDEYLQSFLVDDSRLEEFCIYVTDINNIKNNFFAWVNNYIYQKSADNKWSLEELIQENQDESFLAPEAMISKLEQNIKNEMITTQSIVDFYIKYMWSMQIGRWDNFFVKRFRKDLISKFYEQIYTINKSAQNTYNTKLNNIYNKNNFYYDSFFDSLRYKKWNIRIPVFIKNKNDQFVDLNKIYISNLCSFFQDITLRDTKIYTGNKNIIKKFQEDFSENITLLVNSQSHRLLSYIYGPTISIIYQTTNNQSENLDKIIQQNISTADITRLKDSLYFLDLHMWRDMMQDLAENSNTHLYYDSLQIIGIASTLRENIFWLLLLMQFLKKKQSNEKVDMMIDMLLDIYTVEVLFVDDVSLIKSSIYNTFTKYEYYLEMRIWMDENDQYLKVFLDSRVWYLYNIYNNLNNTVWYEDIIWLKGYLRNLTYYNKRVLINI